MKTKPEPLRGRDGGFTYDSIVKRLPSILYTTISKNQFPPSVQERIVNLAKQLENATLPQNDSIPTCIPEYQEYEKKFQVDKNTWIDLPWFFVENYVYARLLCITGYFDKKSSLYMYDPFHVQKEEGLKSALEKDHLSHLLENVEQLKGKDLFLYLVGKSLWGNQADLSFSGGKKTESVRKMTTENVLVDDVERVWKKLQNIKGSEMSIFVDNCGEELLCDLLLIHYLVKEGFAKRVNIYVKQYPVFVSDAMKKDVEYTIQQLQKNEISKQLGNAFQEHLEKGEWKIIEEKFLNSPLPFWDMPKQLAQSLKSLVILKGDANYRRLLGDLHWDYSTSFEQVVNYFPCSVLCLRTLKSEVALGIKKEKILELEKKDKNWLVNGKYGIIQLLDK